MTYDDDRSSPLARRDVRVSDADRAATADRLSAHAAAGRLRVDELEQRVGAAHAAVYGRDLAALEADLPGPVPARRPARAGARAPWAPAAIALVALAVLLSVAVGHPVGFPLLFAFVVWRLAAGRPRHRLSSGRSFS